MRRRGGFGGFFGIGVEVGFGRVGREMEKEKEESVVKRFEMAGMDLSCGGVEIFILFVSFPLVPQK